MREKALLEVFVGPGCEASETARAMLDRVKQAGLPGLETRLTDLGDPGASKPSVVFAVPTYLLDGKIVSLGNPEINWLLARLAEVLG